MMVIQRYPTFDDVEETWYKSYIVLQRFPFLLNYNMFQIVQFFKSLITSRWRCVTFKKGHLWHLKKSHTNQKRVQIVEFSINIIVHLNRYSTNYRNIWIKWWWESKTIQSFTRKYWFISCDCCSINLLTVRL